MVPKHVRPEASLASGGPPGPGATAVPERHSWQEWQGEQAWGPPPALHPDHPSAPMPAVQLPADHPSAPMPAVQLPAGQASATWPTPRAPGTSDPSQRRPMEPTRIWSATWQTPVAGHGNGNRAAGYWEQTGPGRPGTTDFHREIGPSEPGGPAAGWFGDVRSPGTDPLWAAGQLLKLAEGQAAQIIQGARDDAAATREAAQREAAAIRQAAEREAAEMRVRLDTISSQLSRVAMYVSESLAAPSMPATAPALPGPAPGSAGPTLPDTSPVRKGTGPVRPGTGPARKGTGPAKPAKRGTKPAGPGAKPTQNPQKRPRQLQAMRIATYATAAMLLFAIVSGAVEIGMHGFKFFVFRAGGTGETQGNQTDHQFLVRQAAAAHPATTPKGRHHRKSHHTDKVHNK